MKKNSAMKKLVAAILMLAVSAASLLGSTYAWFSMSKDVTVTGMEVTAKSDGIFLEVSGTQDTGEGSTPYTVYGITGTNALNVQLFPVHHETWSALADITDFDLATAGTYDNWYYRYNANANHATNAMTAKTYISAFTNYVAVTTFKVRLHEGSQATGYDLRVKSITIPDDTGITVVVAGANGYVEYSETTEDIDYADTTVLSNTVTTTAQDVTVYIYFNGDDANVYTDNITELTGEVEIVLTADPIDNE